MPPRKATPGKPRAVSGLELDHPGPAWSAGQGENRRTPAKPSAAADDEQPKTANRAKTPAKSPARAAAPKSPASAAGKRTKMPAKAPASPKAASPAKPAAKSPAKSPKAAAPARTKSPAAKPAAAKTPRASAARAPKPVPESTAQSARKQLNEVGLGDYWTAPSSRRKAAKAEEARAGSPAAARPGDAPPGYEDEDEPIYSVGGGWLVNKILLSCIILTLASAAEQLYRTRSVGARQLGTFAAWGVVSGTVSELWAKALGYATESLEVGTRRTVLTVLVDQLTMIPFMAGAFIAFVCACAGMGQAAIVAKLGSHFVELIAVNFGIWLGAYMLNPQVPHEQLIIVCRIEQLAHAGYLAAFAAKLVA